MLCKRRLYSRPARPRPYISETVRDRGIVTMEDEYKVVCALSKCRFLPPYLKYLAALFLLKFECSTVQYFIQR